MARSAPKMSAATPKAASSSPAHRSWSAHRRADDMPPPLHDPGATIGHRARNPQASRCAAASNSLLGSSRTREARSEIHSARDGAWIPALRFAPAGMTGGGDEEDD